MPLYISQSGDLDRCYRCLTHSHLKDRATQFLIKYKSGALVTQFRKYAFSGGSALIITISHRGAHRNLIQSYVRGGLPNSLQYYMGKGSRKFSRNYVIYYHLQQYQGSISPTFLLTIGSCSHLTSPKFSVSQ